LAPGATWRYTFTKPGTYQVFCVVHPFMKGVVIVKEGK
jgi:plastocyanin